MSHWATPLIGRPWEPNAAGPDSFDCWGLVRYVFALRHGLQLPQIEVSRRDDRMQERNVAAIKRGSQANGWHQVGEPAQEDDIVLMRGRAGRHVGVMVRANGLLGVLHADGTLTDRGPVGCVVFQSLRKASADGYGEYEFWRRA